MYVNKSHSARGFINFCLTIDSVLRVADSSIHITNQLKQLQVQMYASSVLTNNQNCPILNVQIVNNNNNYKFETHFMFAMATEIEYVF